MFFVLDVVTGHIFVTCLLWICQHPVSTLRVGTQAITSYDTGANSKGGPFG